MVEDLDKHNIEKEDEEFSFSPVVSGDDDDDTGGPKHGSSVRLEKLRSYYKELGDVRVAMEEDLKATLKGEVVEGEIEAKLYEFSHSWKAVAGELEKIDGLKERRRQNLSGEYHVGQNLMGVDYEGVSLSNADFSASNLQDANFKNAKLVGVDFSGADLSGADLSGADLTNAIFAGSKLKGTNFTGARMEGVILRDADIEDAILLDIIMDELAIEELQALVEYLAIYYPHKLNLRRLNLFLLDLRRIDLRYVSLRGVDFTGIDFTGVNIAELDLSQCIITPQQIAQALGRVPNAEELKKILAPKNKKKAKAFYIDFTEFLSNGHFTGWIDLTKKSISTDQLVKSFLKLKSTILQKPEDKDEVIFEKAKQFHAERLAEEQRVHNAEQRKTIEERKRKMLEEKQAGKLISHSDEKYVPIKVNLGREA